MKIDFLTLFPEMFQGVLHSSILKQAQERGAVSFRVVNFREYSENKHKKVDDYPYGGGAGMVLSPQPLFDAVEDLTKKSSSTPRVILMCPQGETFTQRKAEELAQAEHLILLCGHYEGYDERIRSYLVTDELSIGDYVLTGGELGAMVIADSVTRLLPAVLGNETSAQTDSFSTGLLEYPQYTRPADFRGWKVPDVLLSGHHQNIERWRKEQSLKRTLERRPDLLEGRKLTEEEQELLDSIRKQQEK
ncbi:tRNA (guanosine(37)-N1)-methyltransferase TrmD [Halalkalibacterium halodurans]|uniref:tRNA (guanine-N(1)-)-methyltransferase n=1 Tax=Halalkalibacterium halodurans (strain ATCC BAA-125 / DSM 18197 / FERM 7344 / JCM 9153 / C-125) TaxID=272558 RepID=TRMD_HALH5|nr:tRNA (guanosine(37)-N1)-methyltransferase TrmD [Halalkalibacterium halodurans]Q9KA15.1 RecName: Full=tRNA (guanine-N(1)-)-methyltransferase; AltName: Full=M1G-methyltransferase; AltName: Full=tRNA [GM37] methyltransferase [Halalkalibacterium halodurans C-125]MED4081526.1 tRNA (guanosine(37)-N1)-methyltransferase TrmD [Halalkalibacterium halodurans]MED4086142.1 tRNA (guanosine(37)-N1)-methyltransferase TrmD [Halalkalibacterium halodurans]MED4106216.1 tRNA (guanosine(37)-N1)-methyltransferase 